LRRKIVVKKGGREGCHGENWKRRTGNNYLSRISTQKQPGILPTSNQDIVGIL
jgi:hypothetical protein